MAKAICISVITFFVSIYIEAKIGVGWNMPGIGILFAVVVMGGFIIASIEKKK